ncbi:MAG: response regulator [candidate division Zixibacteria bacterium]|nr:response regulator [candidate division Zixibacteria bacterium]
MTDPIRILYIEDSPADFELAEHELRKAGIPVVMRRVEEHDEFVRALDEFAPQLIISDFSLPSFDAFAALQVVRATRPTLPFILCTGTIGDELAVEIMRGGATDYVLKTRMGRLVPSVLRALQEVKERAERERVQNELIESEHRYTILFTNMPLGFACNEVVLDEHGQPCDYIFREVNGAFETQMGLSRNDLLGKRATEVMPWLGTTGQDLLNNFSRVALHNEIFRFQHFWEPLQIWHDVTAYSPRKGFVVTLVRDITTEKQMEIDLHNSEQQLLHSQKMEAVGRLAGGIAHDFNNLLTVISGFSYLVLKRLGPSDPLRREVEEIHRAAERAAALTWQLLAFSRKQVTQPKVIDLNAIVTDVSKMLRRLLGEDVTLHTTLAPSLGCVRADPSHLEQVITNLAVNARDAMPSGGSLEIETANVTFKKSAAPGFTRDPAGESVMLAVRDTGTGMDEATRARIFEPFFTTKEQGKGTGLGLSTVFGIVGQCGGQITVETAPGCGTTMRVFMPRVTAAEVKADSTPVTAAELTGSETILVAEDDDAVRRLVQTTLEACGYTVIAARNGSEAELLSSRHPATIHLLLTDVVMPGVSGSELAEWIVTQRPDMRVLFMSGYTDDTIVHHGLREGQIDFLEKPFSPDRLAAKVREVLDPQRARGQLPKRPFVPIEAEASEPR